MAAEYSRWNQIWRTPWLFIKNLPGAFSESVKGVPQDIAEGTKGVLEAAGKATGAGLNELFKPLLPALKILAVILTLVLILWGVSKWH